MTIPDLATNATRVPCPVCSALPRPWRVVPSAAGDFAIDRCSGCGFAYVNPRPTHAFIEAYYRTRTDGHGDSRERALRTAEEVLAAEHAYPNSTLDAARIVAGLQDGLGRAGTGRLLDVGCGYGLYARAARAAGFSVMAIELAPVEREIARTMAAVDPLAIPFEQFAADDYSFEAIIMSQILEHAVDVNVWMAKAARLLVRGGVIAIALPNFGSLFRRVMQEREAFIQPPEHLNYFSPDNLAQLLRRHGLASYRTDHVTRIPPTALSRRLPAFARPLLPVGNLALHVLGRACDIASVGQIITVFARRM